MVVDNTRVVMGYLRTRNISVIFNCPNTTVYPFCSGICSSDVARVLIHRRRGTTRTTDNCTEYDGHPNIYITASNPNTAGLVANVTATCASSVPVITVANRIHSSLLNESIFRRTSVAKTYRPFMGRDCLIDGARSLPEIFGRTFRVTSANEPNPMLVSVPISVRRGRVRDFRCPRDMGVVNCGPGAGKRTVRIGGTIRTVGTDGHPIVMSNNNILDSNVGLGLRGFTRAANVPIVSAVVNVNIVPDRRRLCLKVLNARNGTITGHTLRRTSLMVMYNTELNSETITTPSRVDRGAGMVRVSVSPTRVNGGIGARVPVMNSVGGIVGVLLSDVNSCGIAAV